MVTKKATRKKKDGESEEESDLTPAEEIRQTMDEKAELQKARLMDMLGGGYPGYLKIRKEQVQPGRGAIWPFIDKIENAQSIKDMEEFLMTAYGKGHYKVELWQDGARDPQSPVGDYTLGLSDTPSPFKYGGGPFAGVDVTPDDDDDDEDLAEKVAKSIGAVFEERDRRRESSTATVLMALSPVLVKIAEKALDKPAPVPVSHDNNREMIDKMFLMMLDQSKRGADESKVFTSGMFDMMHQNYSLIIDKMGEAKEDGDESVNVGKAIAGFAQNLIRPGVPAESSTQPVPSGSRTTPTALPAPATAGTQPTVSQEPMVPRIKARNRALDCLIDYLEGEIEAVNETYVIDTWSLLLESEDNDALRGIITPTPTEATQAQMTAFFQAHPDYEKITMLLATNQEKVVALVINYLNFLAETSPVSSEESEVSEEIGSLENPNQEIIDVEPQSPGSESGKNDAPGPVTGTPSGGEGQGSGGEADEGSGTG